MKHLVAVCGPSAQVEPAILNSSRSLNRLLYPTSLTKHTVSEAAKAAFASLLQKAEFPYLSTVFEATPVHEMRGILTECAYSVPDIFIVLKARAQYVGFDILQPDLPGVSRQRYRDTLTFAFVEGRMGSQRVVTAENKFNAKIDTFLYHVELFTAIEDEKVTYPVPVAKQGT